MKKSFKFPSILLTENNFWRTFFRGPIFRGQFFRGPFFRGPFFRGLFFRVPCNTYLVWYNEKFVYYPNSPKFYVSFLKKNCFDAIWCIIGTSKYHAKKEKLYYCKEHKSSLMFTGLFILFILPLIAVRELMRGLLAFPWWPPPPFRPNIHCPELYASLYLLFHRPLLYARPMRRVEYCT